MVFTVVTPAEERFRSKYIVKDSGCWEWQGANNGRGYGVFWDYDMARNDGAHRASYRLHVGPIPAGHEIDHLCVNSLCVNPAHLEPVTGAENKRRRAMRQTHCPSNHPWDAENTRIYRGHRRCKACDREQHRARKLATEQYDLGLWIPTEGGGCVEMSGESRQGSPLAGPSGQVGTVSPSKEVDNVRAQEDTGTTTEQGSKA